MTATALIDRLEFCKPTGKGEWAARCPAHSDSTPSLSIKELDDGRTLIHCLAYETEIITSQGIFQIGDLDGETVELMTSGPGGGNWVSAPIKSYGRQRLYKITFERNQYRKTVYATDGHRWFSQHREKAPVIEVLTKDLKPGMRMKSVFKRRTVKTVSAFGVAHGFTFGDGTIVTGNYACHAQFCGEKDEAMLSYFPNMPIKDYGDVKRVSGLPSFFKSPPEILENNQYLLGFLAGYFAADGCVSEKGHATISSGSRDSLIAFKEIGLKVGIGSYQIREHMRKGYGAEKTPLYQMTLRHRDLFGEFFVLDKHRDRFEKSTSKEKKKPHRREAWIVESVEATDRIEEVYCAEVPVTHSFVLADNLLTGNCHAGCGAIDVLAAVGLDFSALYPPTDRHQYHAEKKRREHTLDELVVEIAIADMKAGKELSAADREAARAALMRLDGAEQ